MNDRMKRREFVTLVGGAAASIAWPLAARTQQPARIRRIALLMPWAENDPEIRPRVAALHAGLREVGWEEGHNVEFLFRWASGAPDRIRAFAAELVAMAPDVIVASTTPAVRALASITSTIPVVFIMVVDPVGQGLVQSLSKPGSNFTGFTHFEFGMGGKWLQLLKEIAPGVANVAVIFNPDTAPYHPSFINAVDAAALWSSVKPIAAPARSGAELERFFVAFSQHPSGGLLILPDTFTTVNRALIVALAARHQLPAMYPLTFFAVQGGLMSYGPNLVDLYHRAALYVHRVLNGASPSDLPVQQPTKFELIINLKTAKALGLEIPSSLLARADEVIE
jgi:putative ABC transport system substrate-binding protein